MYLSHLLNFNIANMILFNIKYLLIIQNFKSNNITRTINFTTYMEQSPYHYIVMHQSIVSNLTILLAQSIKHDII